MRELWQLVNLDGIKTVTIREFFPSPGLVQALQPGQTMFVTDNGAPAFTVIRAGKRKIKNRGDLEREAAEICPETSSKVNFTGGYPGNEARMIYTDGSFLAAL